MSLRTKYADFTFPAEDLTGFDGAMVTAQAKIAVLPELETAQVKHLAKIGNKSESFAREAYALGKQHPGLLPRDLDLQVLERTLQTRDMLRERFQAAKSLMERIDAAIVLLGVDSYRDGLDIYNALKRGGTTQSLRDAVRELGKIFRKAQAEQETSEPSGTDTESTGTNH